MTAIVLADAETAARSLPSARRRSASRAAGRCARGSRAAWPGARLAAPAYPVRCTPGDNLAVHVAVTTAPGGSVLVVDVGDVAELGYWGEVLTTAAEARGIVGLVIDGGVRDVAALEAHGFPVFSTQIALPGATKHRPGHRRRRRPVGGVEVGSGDWIVGDARRRHVVPGATLDARPRRGPGAGGRRRTRMFRELRAGQTTRRAARTSTRARSSRGDERGVDMKVLVATDGSDLSVDRRAPRVRGARRARPRSRCSPCSPRSPATTPAASRARPSRRSRSARSGRTRPPPRRMRSGATLAEVHGAHASTRRVEVG